MRRFLLLCLTICLLPIASARAVSRDELRLIECWRSGELIRLHILAEDDTPAAQSVKLRVRDALLRAFADAFAAATPDALYDALAANADAMRLVAEETARASGFTGDVAAEVGLLDLPEKRYGSVLLPAGQYRGLRVTLGTGRGRNWWCVLFPSLCLASSSDAPWQTQPEVTFDSLRILSLWTMFGDVKGEEDGGALPHNPAGLVPAAALGVLA